MLLRRAGVMAAGLLVMLSVESLAGQSATTWIAGGGLSLPAGDFHSYANIGWGGVAGFERRFGRHPTAFRVDVDYAVNRDSTAIGFHETTTLMSALASIVYHFDGAHPHLYVLVGLGYFHRRFASDDPDDIPISDSHPALQVGEGVTFRVKKVNLFVEGRFVSSVGSGAFTFFPVVAGVRF